MQSIKTILLVLGISLIAIGILDFEGVFTSKSGASLSIEINEDDIVSFGDEEFDAPRESGENYPKESFGEDLSSMKPTAGEIRPTSAMIVFEDIGQFSIPIDPYFIGTGIIYLFLAALFFWRRSLAEKFANWTIALIAFTLFFGVLALTARGTEIAVGGMLSQSLRLATPVILGAMVGTISEKSGIVNIGIEGTMLIGACFGFLGAVYSGCPYTGVLVGMASGVFVSALHALLSISFRTDQIISGTFVNILAVGVTGFLRAKYIVGSASIISILPTLEVPILKHIPFLGPLLFINKPIVLFMLVFVPLLYFILGHTSYGLKTRAVGEHPKSADTVGINVNRLRYINVLIAGAIAGIAGSWFSVETTGSFDDLMTSGKGFIALAAMIFGRYNPLLIFAGALLFGFADALQIKLQITNPDIPYQFLSMVPYLITMVVLAGVIGKAHPPKAVGKPYVK